MNKEIHNIKEDNKNAKGLCTKDTVDTDIQRALINMLYEQGILTESVHSAAVNKITKGVVQ